MQKNLFFICPTDNLKPVIDNRFKHENHYFTSLGNSIIFDKCMMAQISLLLQTKNVNSISFVLSDNNRIVSEPLSKKDFSEILELGDLYNQIAIQREYTEGVWQTYDRQFLMLSYHLNYKIKELKMGLKCLSLDPSKIDGKIYNRREGIFSNIYSDLICNHCVSMN